MNAAGDVAGTATMSNFPLHAFRWTAQEGMRDLGTLSGTSSEAVAITASGDVFDYASTNYGRLNLRVPEIPNDGMVIAARSVGVASARRLGCYQSGL